jgi:hypothetical protein
MNPDYSLADWVSNRGTLGARKPLRAPGPIWGGLSLPPQTQLIRGSLFGTLGQQCACQICT